MKTIVDMKDDSKKERSHAENEKIIYDMYKYTDPKRAEEYKQERIRMNNLLGQEGHFNKKGCLIPIIAILSSVMSFIYFFVVLG
ncbi:hypothetical protein OAN93_01125 [Candidatus Marinimicrobia bacterium]|nr:hypothetical protein [Candidatus Neomarinimicrobiota bacterium]